MQFKVEPRRQVSTSLLWLTPVLSVLCTVAVAAILFVALGYNAVRALGDLFVAPLLSVQGLTELALKASPLVMIGVGLAAGFRANVWNIGAEGQLTMGAIAGGGIALAFYGQSGIWILPLMCLAGILGGMAWGAIPAFLKTRFDVSEILVSLMLTYVAALFLSMLVLGPWKDPEGMNFPQSRMFSDSALLPVLIEGTRLNVGALVALGVAVVGWLVMSRSILGLRDSHRRHGARGGPLRRVQPQPRGVADDDGRQRARRAGRRVRGGRPHRPAHPDAHAGLRLHGDHRRLPRPAPSPRHPGGGPGHGADLHRRRQRAGGYGAAERHGRAGSGDAAVLPARL